MRRSIARLVLFWAPWAWLPFLVWARPSILAPRRSYSVPLSLTLPLHLHHTRQLLELTNATLGAGLLSVTPSRDKQTYFTVIKAGNISFRVALDTASSDLWLSSSACTTSSCRRIPSYPLSYPSPSFLPVNANLSWFNASYADGTSASGFVARESVQLSGLVIDDQAFGLVDKTNVTFDDQISGIMGLGFPRLSTIYESIMDGTPFFPKLAQQGKLDYPLFGLSLRRNAPGSLSLGAIDGSVVKDETQIEWHQVVPFPPVGSENNVSSYLSWAIVLERIIANGSSIDPLPSYPTAGNGRSLALFDIGTDGLYGPYQDVSRIFDAIPNARLVDLSGQWVAPCDTTATLAFNFGGGRSFVLNPSDYLIGPASGNPNLCLTWPRATPPNTDGIDWQLGNRFLRTVYSIFSYGINTKEPPLIGLYPLQNLIASSDASDSLSTSSTSSGSATVATTLPNYPLATPSYPLPAYAFNTSVPAAVGQIVVSELATSTYSALFGTLAPNATTLPTIGPMVTIIVTSVSGTASTSTSTIAEPSVALGQPPGRNAAKSTRAPIVSILLSCLLFFISWS